MNIIKRLFPPFVIVALLAAAPAWANAADGIVSKPLQFTKGTSSATVNGAIKGYQIIDYKLRAKAGQTMTASLQTSNPSSYFNVLPPGSDDVAIFVGSTSGNEFSGALPSDGEYRIRVYMMRNAARRNETANFTLKVGITGSAAATAAPALGAAPAGDAKVKGTSYHATGQVDCSMGNAPAGSQQCDFGVIRGKPGNAEMHVTPSGGFKRVLIFTDGKVRSDADSKVKASKNGDMWTIEVNDYEHYKFPEALIDGG